ncbi:hypothetical protein GH714_003167 [Hevea brasiliensis]|uniref:Uncharacterized protein n=1 Tax=Hevea brasiliensis TaxID=3981 RepID=A0A6A6N279_HEVBR|nr:hypothetical protein GH714_003167 [Hevea brasiliensis]
MFRVSLTNSAPNGVVSFEMAKGSVLNEEMRRRSQGSSSQTEVIGIEGVCLDTSNGMKVMPKDVKNAPNVHLKFISAGRLDDKGYLNIRVKVNGNSQKALWL